MDTDSDMRDSDSVHGHNCHTRDSPKEQVSRQRRRVARMKICEGCIKQDVCKFKENVEKLEKKSMECPEPLVPDMTCKHKVLERIPGCNWEYLPEPIPNAAWPWYPAHLDHPWHPEWELTWH